MTDTDVTFLQYYRSCPYERHDLYLPSIPASLQTLGRIECAVASAQHCHTSSTIMGPLPPLEQLCNRYCSNTEMVHGRRAPPRQT